MFNAELYLPQQERSFRSTKTGRFVKGHTPANKGKKWSDYMGKRAQKRAAKGWKNLETHRPKTRPDTAGRCRKGIIAVMDDGTWKFFSHAGMVVAWCGGCAENVRRCCRFNNAEGNTDHRYMGHRFYFEESDIWMNKIND